MAVRIAGVHALSSLAKGHKEYYGRVYATLMVFSEHALRMSSDDTSHFLVKAPPNDWGEMREYDGPTDDGTAFMQYHLLRSLHGELT